MYTQPAFQNTRNAPPRAQVLPKKISKEKTGEIPMKALLRSSIFALFVFAGYAAVATDISKPHSNAQFPQPQCPPRALCAIGK
jgi:hypothetical protein